MYVKTLLVAVCLAYVASATPDTRIAGGSPATVEQFPFVSALLYYYQRPDLWVQRCVGTVVSSWHIVTSAECFRGADLSNLLIRAGSTYSMSGGQVTTARQVTLHPEYVASPRKNDIAVVLLQDPLRIGSTLNVLFLPPKNTQIPTGLQTTVVSWGFEAEQGPVHNSLQSILLNTVSLEECKKAYAGEADVEINENVLCAHAGVRGVCTGDSGAPLVHGTVLLGVSSTFKDCGNAAYPDVFTRVDAYTEWIMGVAVAPSS